MAGGMGCLKKACLPREEREEQLLLPLLSNHWGESHTLADFFFSLPDENSIKQHRYSGCQTS